jgi:hypothetical protein
MRPLAFVKAHPLATVLLLATGYMVVPWTLGKVQGATGVGVSLPQPGS